MRKETKQELLAYANSAPNDPLSIAYMRNLFSEEIDKLAVEVLYSGRETKERRLMASYILCRPIPRRYAMSQGNYDPHATFVFYLTVAGLVAMLLIILAAFHPAAAGSRTLDELLAMDDTSYEAAVSAAGKHSLAEQQCDCVIQHGVKIHGYPGAWSTRNRRNREDDINININGWPE